MAMGGTGGGSGSGGIRAGRAFVEFSAKDAGLRTFLTGLRKRLDSFGASMTRIGAGVALGGVARLVPLVAAVGKLGELSKMKDAATALNMTAEGASGLFGVLSAMGGDFKEDLEGITQFSGRVRDALAGVGGPTGEAARLFEGLSVQAKDLEGLPLDEQFLRVLGAIRELPQELQATRLGLMGGTDSMKKWLGLLARSPEQVRAQAKALASTSAELDEAQKATLAYQAATTQLGLVWQKVAIAVAPVIEQTANWGTSVLGPIARFVEQNKAMVLMFVASSAATVALGAGLMTVGLAASGAAAVLTAAGVAASFLLTPFGAMVAVVAALGAGFVYLTGLGSTLRATFAGISDALAVGDLELAWKVGLAGIGLEWLRLVETLTATWNEFKSFFVDGWHSAVYLVRRELNDLQTWVARQMVAGLKVIESTFGSLFDRLGVANPVAGLGFDQMAATLEQMRREEERAIDRRFAKEQEARDAARKGDLEAAGRAREQAEAARLQLLTTAAFRRAFGGGGGAAAGLPGAGSGAAAAGMNAVKGAFAGFGSLQSIFGGGVGRDLKDEMRKNTKAAEAGNELLEDIADAVRDMPGAVWGF